jgi:hypothetical protein
MKFRTMALFWVAVAATVCAQTAPPSQRVTQAAKPAAARARQARHVDSAVRARPAARRARRPARPSAAEPAAAAVKKAAVRMPSSAETAKRDPFISPIREQGLHGPACTTGKKCLAISAIVLRGVVRSQAGMIAVVESSTRRISYFLRENDPVFNGYVVRITANSVVFRENVMDRLGRQSTRDVVMKVIAPVV